VAELFAGAAPASTASSIPLADVAHRRLRLAGLGLGFGTTAAVAQPADDQRRHDLHRAGSSRGHSSHRLRYRLALGKNDTSPDDAVGIGYGKRLFSARSPKLRSGPGPPT